MTRITEWTLLVTLRQSMQIVLLLVIGAVNNDFSVRISVDKILHQPPDPNKKKQTVESETHDVFTTENHHPPPPPPSSVWRERLRSPPVSYCRQ